jgi:cell division protein FtsZ
LINVDFADVRTVMSEMGMAMMGTGTASGPGRARSAAEAAIRSPLLEDVDLNGARGILVNVSGGSNLSIGEFSEVGKSIEEFASPNATVVIGMVIDESLGEDIMVTVVATGLGNAAGPSVVVDNSVARDVASGRLNMNDLDTPTYVRNQPSQAKDVDAIDIQGKDLDYLDVPAFLRRQAD